MKTLVIDTTGQINRFAIFQAEKQLGSFESDLAAKRSGSETLLETIKALLEKAETDSSELDLIITALGPGSYTGSRSGLSFAKALSQATKIPLTGVSILDVILFSSDKPKMPLAVTLPAGDDRIYTKSVSTIEDIFATRQNGEVMEKKELKSDNVLEATTWPALAEINKYGVQYFKENGADDFLTLLPLYLKEPNITQPKKS
jgi:tRNA threonylcarbamoyl adenosine modification protein YeaZ